MSIEFTVDELLTPLALTVIIDGKVREPEMSEFLDQAEGLLELLGVEQSRENIRAWFKKRGPEISKSLAGRGKNTFVLKTLSRFKNNDAVVEALYDAMLAISISDSEYHETESELVKSAASLWGYARPPFKVIRK